MTDETESTGGEAAGGEGSTPESGATPEAGSTPENTENTENTTPEAHADESAAPEAEPKSEDGGKGDETETASDEWALTAPEGMEQFQPQFDDFRSDMTDWLKANPDASPQDALTEAARLQAVKVAEQETAAVTEFNEQVSTWEAELRKDPDIGGENYDENVALAVKGLEAVGAEGLKDLLASSGFGSHPAVVKTFQKIGKLVAEDKIIGEAGAQRDPHAARFPSSVKK